MGDDLWEECERELDQELTVNDDVNANVNVNTLNVNIYTPLSSEQQIQPVQQQEHKEVKRGRGRPKGSTKKLAEERRRLMILNGITPPEPKKRKPKGEKKDKVKKERKKRKKCNDDDDDDDNTNLEPSNIDDINVDDSYQDDYQNNYQDVKVDDDKPGRPRGRPIESEEKKARTRQQREEKTKALKLMKFSQDLMAVTKITKPDPNYNQGYLQLNLDPNLDIHSFDANAINNSSETKSDVGVGVGLGVDVNVNVDINVGANVNVNVNKTTPTYAFPNSEYVCNDGYYSLGVPQLPASVELYC